MLRAAGAGRSWIEVVAIIRKGAAREKSSRFRGVSKTGINPSLLFFQLFTDKTYKIIAVFLDSS